MSPLITLRARAICLLFASLSACLIAVTSLPAQAQTPAIPLWSGFQVKGDIAYLLRKSPTEIMRFDLAQAQWLPSLPLQDIPSAFVVGDTHIYVASDRKIERLDLQGGNKMQVANTPDTVVGLFLDGNLLIANRSQYLYARFSSYSTVNNVLIDTHEGYPHSLFGASHSPATNRIYGRTEGISPADIDYLQYDNAGNFLSQHDSPYHGDYPYAATTWVWPDGSKVIDSSGTIYLGIDLTYAGTLPNTINDVGFVGADVPIVLAGSQLVAYNQAQLETGRRTLSLPGRNLVVRGSTIFVFNEDAASLTRVGIEQVPLGSLSPVQPGTPISPVGLAYSATSVTTDQAGVIYVLSKVHSSIFRWDVVTQKYLATIPLAQTGDSLVYSSASSALFLLGSNKTVYKIALGQPTLIASPFVSVPPSANFLLPLGQDLLVASNGSWNLQWIYSASGTLLNSSFTCCYGYFHFYDQARSRLFLDQTFVSYLGNGQFSNPVPGPYFSQYVPIRLSPDGQRTVTRAGVLYQASPLQAIDYLSNNIVDAQWGAPTQLFTIREASVGPQNGSRVQKWSPYLTIDREQSLLGQHVALLRADQWLVEVTTANDVPRFHVLDFALNTVAPAIIEAPVIAVSGATGLAVGLSWTDVQGESSYQVERRTADVGTWLQVGVASQDASGYVDVENHGGKRWDYRVRALNGSVISPWSNVVSVDLSNIVVPPPVDPTTVLFSIDDAHLGIDGRIYILSKQHKSIFVWNTTRQRFDRSIGLRDTPLYMTYSGSRDVIFTGYADRSIFSISPSATIAYEYPFTTTTDGLCGLIAADDMLVACDYSGAWESTHTYDSLGQLIDYKEWRSPIAGGIWSAERQRIFHFRDGSSPNDLLYTPIASNGQIGLDVDSPYHSSEGIQYPIRVSPDGAVVVLGSGHIFDALSLTRLGVLANPISDAVWLNGRLLTLEGSAVASRVQLLGASQQVITINGIGRRLFAAGGSRLVVAIERNGTTVFETYNAAFERIEPPLHSDGFE